MENARLFLVLALGFLLLLLWNAWQQDYNAPPPVEVTEQVPAPEAVAPGAVTPDVAPSATPAAAATAQQVRVVTDLLDVVINTRGGEIIGARLPAYTIDVESDELFSILNPTPPDYYIAQAGLQAQDGPAPGADAVFAVEDDIFVLEDGEDALVVPLVWESPEGVRVVKRYIFERDSYVVRLEQEVLNASNIPWQGFQYLQLRRTRPVDEGSFLLGAQAYTGGIIHSPEEPYTKIDFDEIAAAELRRDVEGGWFAFIQHYFLSAWIPPEEGTYRYYAREVNGQYILGASSQWKIVEPGATAEYEAKLYVGPKEQDRLAVVAPDLELTVDYGMLTVISKPLFWLLTKIHDFVGNWGWSIVLLVLLIKLVFFKLSEASYRSMARMRTMQPKMQALKERYGDDRQKLNQALMEMYKKEKINPLAGCLPILVQIPVFIALYWALLESVELRHADFLWMEDLSSPDPFFILPIVMGLTMLLQQRLNPAPMDPVQQKVLMFLPIVFTVFFLFFPAGLVVYWVTNNILSIAQQWLITRRVEKGQE